MGQKISFKQTLYSYVHQLLMDFTDLCFHKVVYSDAVNVW